MFRNSKWFTFSVDQGEVNARECMVVFITLFCCFLFRFFLECAYVVSQAGGETKSEAMGFYLRQTLILDARFFWHFNFCITLHCLRLASCVHSLLCVYRFDSILRAFASYRKKVAVQSQEAVSYRPISGWENALMKTSNQWVSSYVGNIRVEQAPANCFLKKRLPSA